MPRTASLVASLPQKKPMGKKTMNDKQKRALVDRLQGGRLTKAERYRRRFSETRALQKRREPVIALGSFDSSVRARAARLDYGLQDLRISKGAMQVFRAALAAHVESKFAKCADEMAKRNALALTPEIMRNHFQSLALA